MPRATGLRRSVLAACALAAVAVLVTIAGGAAMGMGRPDGVILAALVAGFGAGGVMVALWARLDGALARPADALAAALRARAHGGVSAPMDVQGAMLGDLPDACADIAQALSEARADLAQAGARETERLGQEKARLEALLSDVPVAVLLCDADHRIAFYNSQAAEILGAGAAPGLDRTALDYLRPGPLRQAYARLAALADRNMASDLLCTTRTGGHVLSGRMRVLRRLSPDRRPGYVLTLRDVTADVMAHARRDRLLSEMMETIRRPAAALQAAANALEAAEGPPPPALMGAVSAEAVALTRALDRLGQEVEDAQAQGRPLVGTRTEDLWDGLAALFEAQDLQVRTRSLPLIAQVDGFELIALLAGLAARVAQAQGVHTFDAELIEEDGPGGVLQLSWEGPVLGVGLLDDWLEAPLGGDAGDLTGTAVLRAHGTQIWPEADETGARLVMPILNVRRAVERPQPVRRAVVYDFDLMGKSRGAQALADTRLRDLSFVVFDTETTGLDSARDEIVQIAAVRIVNGRRVPGEVFDTLVDPCRPIPPASTAVHGITDSMVVGAPRLPDALAQMHAFARGAVLVAHNAPFDMAFLRRGESGEIRFDHPVLDTVLLSAIVFGQLERHTLDALSARLGITIPDADRHTALGDTIATADALLRLIAMLEARGLDTFGKVIAEGHQHARLIEDQNG